MRKVSKNDYGYDSVFPRRLRKLMDDNKTTQAVLADECGVARQAVSQWRDGNTRPDILSLQKIAEFYNVSADYLLGLCDVATTDTDIKAVCEDLGLDENAIEALKLSRDYLEKVDCAHALNYLVSELPEMACEFSELSTRVLKFYKRAYNFSFTPPDFFHSRKCLEKQALDLVFENLENIIYDKNGKLKTDRFSEITSIQYVQIEDAQDLIKAKVFNIQSSMNEIAEMFCLDEIKRLNEIAQAAQERRKDAGTTESGEGEADEKP